MHDNKRIEKEKTFWDKLSTEFDMFIQKNWKVYASKLLNKILDDVDTNSTVLEVACGTGLVALEVSKKAKKVYGIDIASSMIDEAKKKMKEKKIDNLEFSVEDAYKLPLDNNMFDIVICNNALHNMMYPRKALSEIMRVLKSGGKLIATIVGIGESPKYKIAITIYNLFVKLPIFHKLNLDGFSNMIAESGFSIINKEIIRDPKDKMPLLYIIAKKQ